MAVKIEKGIPIPARVKEIANEYVGVIEKMHPGDSFLAKKMNQGDRNLLLVAARRHFGNGTLITRTTDKGVRVWRVK